MKTKHLIQLRAGDKFKQNGKILTLLSNPEIKDGLIRFEVIGDLGVEMPYRADTNWKVELVEPSQAV